MDDGERATRSKSHDLERQSSSDSYASTNEERQTANWIEVRLIGSGGFGNVTLWKNKVLMRMLTVLLHVNEYTCNNKPLTACILVI